MIADSVTHNVIQCCCFVIAFALMSSFVIRYYLAILYEQEKATKFFNSLSKKYGFEFWKREKNNVNCDDYSYKFEISDLLVISKWKVNKIESKKEISSLNLTLISIMFSYVAVLFVIIEQFTNAAMYTDNPTGTILNQIAIAIGFLSQFIFGFSTTDHLISILHNSIYQLSNKSIKIMQIANTFVVASFLPMFIIVAKGYIGRETDSYNNNNNNDSNYNSDTSSRNLIEFRIGVLCGSLLVLSEIVLIVTIMRLYYTKLGRIINDLHNFVTSHHVEQVEQVEQITQRAERKLLDNLVQSIFVNLLFVCVLLLEMSMVACVNMFVQESKVQLRSKIRNTLVCVIMVFMIAVNSLQAGFNVTLYRKWCNKWHNCCLLSVQWCLYTQKQKM